MSRMCSKPDVSIRQGWEVDIWHEDIFVFLPLRCHKQGHIARDCTMYGEECYNCGELGHIARECPRDRRRYEENGEGGSSSDETLNNDGGFSNGYVEDEGSDHQGGEEGKQDEDETT